MFLYAGLSFEHVIPTNTVSSHDLKPDSRPAEIEKTSDAQESLQLFTSWIDVEAERQNCSIARMFSVDVSVYDQHNQLVATNCDLWWFINEPDILFAVDTSTGGGIGSIVGVSPLFY